MCALRTLKITYIFAMFNVYYFFFFICLRPESPARVALPNASPAAFQAGFLFLPNEGVDIPKGSAGPDIPPDISSTGSSSSSRSSIFFFEILELMI